MKLVFLYNKRFTPPPLRDAFSDWECAAEPAAACDVLLRWGSVDGADECAGTVLNRKQPLKNCLDKEKIFEFLKVNRIRKPRLVMPTPDSNYPVVAKRCNAATGAENAELVTDFHQALNSGANFFVEYINTVKKYNVYLFNLNVFLLTKKVAVRTNTRTGRNVSWEYEEVPGDLDRETQKISLLAQRAVHILGLDFAMVHAAIDTYGRPVVLDITPVPALSEYAAWLFRQQVDRFVDSRPEEVHRQGPALPPEKTVMIGADPEFVLRDRNTGQIVYPSDYLHREGRLGYDERSERREGLLFPLAEIRPEPDYCPVRLTGKMRVILETAASVFPPNLEWLAGSLQFEQYQTGGHIHFSNICLTSRLLRALDNYLGIPVMLIEDPATSARRRRQYGWLSSFRPKPHGGFEYRTPASWLVSPEITLACLSLAKIIATEYHSLPRDYFTDPNLQKAFYQSKKYYFYDIFRELWSDIQATSLFQLYGQHLTPITNLISARSHWDESVDLRKTWGILQ